MLGVLTVKWVGLFLVILFAASHAASQVPNDKAIVPGQRIGKWTLQMSMAELVQMNGPASIRPAGFGDNAPGALIHEWNHLGLWASTLGRTERIAYLIAVDTTYKTAKGVTVDASPEAVEAAYGKPTAISTPLGSGLQRWIYDDLGLFFVIRNNIGVFQPGMAKQLWRY